MLTKIVKEVAKEFYENGYDIEIIEKHHNQKIDAPSGTAKLLYDVIHEDIEETKEVYDRSTVHHNVKEMKLVFNLCVLEQFLVNIVFYLRDMMKLLKSNIQLYQKKFLYKGLFQHV